MFTVTGKGITTKDPELRTTTNGTSVCNCTLVNHEKYNGNETSHFTNVVVWGDLADDFAKEVEKGCLLDITGILKHPMREINGTKRYLTEVVITEYTLERNFNDEKKNKGKNYGSKNKGGKYKK